MKSVKKILAYQKTIERVLAYSPRKVLELENLCLCGIGHVACWESYVHALKDLIACGRAEYSSGIVSAAV